VFGTKKYKEGQIYLNNPMLGDSLRRRRRRSRRTRRSRREETAGL